jgi:oligopeptide transport system substrate-binding protein
VRIRHARHLAITAAAAVALLPLAPTILAAHRPTSPAPVRGGTLTVPFQFPPSTLDVAKSADGGSIPFTTPIYDTLIQFAPEKNWPLAPDLATRWQIKDGGREYIFYLRHGVRFSNGDPLTAQDVAFTFMRLNQNATAAPYQGSYADLVGSSAVATGKTDTLSGIQTVGKYEVIMHLTDPERYWLDLVAVPWSGIVDESVASQWNAEEKAGKPIDPIGTGPFVLQPVTANSSEYVYLPNKYYWQQGKPYLSKVVYKIGADQSLQLQMFQRGEANALTDTLLSSAEYLVIRQSPSLMKDYYRVPYPGVAYVAFNAMVKPWNSLLVRQAAEYAIDKPFLNAVLNNGRAPIANSMLAPGILGYQPSYDPYPTDYLTPAGAKAAQAKAKALLAKAGYPHGVNAGTFYLPEFGPYTEIASLVKSELAAVGIQVTPKLLTYTAFASLVQQNKTAVGMYWADWGMDYPDPEDFLYNLFATSQGGENNQQWYSNPEVDQLLNQADASIDEPLRLKLYDKVDEIVMSQAATVPFYYSWLDGEIAPNVYPKDPWVWTTEARLQDVWIQP